MSSVSPQPRTPEQDRRREILRGCSHILIIQTKFLGDTFWTIPFVENLRKNLPHVTLSIMVKQGNEAVFRTNPAVQNVLGFPYNDIKNGWGGKKRFVSFIGEIRKLRPDCVIDLTDGDRGALMSFFSGARYRFTYPMRKLLRHKLFNHVVKPRLECHIVQFYADFLELLGLVNVSNQIHYQVSGSALASLQKKAPLAFTDTGRRRVVIHPGSRVPLHQWGAHKYARLCDLLSERFDVFLVGGPGEKEILDQVLGLVQAPPAYVSHALALDEFAALCSRADFFVGNDSGPIHVAAATGAFVFGLYGPTYEDYSGPITDKRCIIEKGEPPCQPCVRSYCSHESYRACLELISPEEVMGKIEEQFPKGC
jgi:ADP-heptose:LPS heptosyltransferase